MGDYRDRMGADTVREVFDRAIVHDVCRGLGFQGSQRVSECSTILASRPRSPVLDRSIAERRADAEPASLATRRRAGLAAFEQAAMPTEADEHWKYIDLDFDLDDLVLPDAPGPDLPEVVDAGPVTAKIVDGFVTLAEALPASVTIDRFVSVA